ncbi:RNA-directed RNA polymerase [Apiospora arundinis]
MLALVHFDSVDDMIKYMEHEHEVSHSDNWSPCFGDVGICSAQQGHPLDRDPREVETAGSFLHDSGFARQMVPQRHGAGHPVPTAEAREPPAGRRHLSGRVSDHEVHRAPHRRRVQPRGGWADLGAAPGQRRQRRAPGLLCPVPAFP